MLVPMFLSAQDLTLKKHPKKELWGYWGVKSNGKENFIIKPQFEQAGPFVKGQAFVCKKGKWSIIDNSGKVVLQTTYTKVDVSSPNKSHFRVWNSDKCGMFDVAALREVLDVKYTKIEVWQSNLYKLHIDNYQGLANFAGRTILPVKYSGISVWLGGGYLLKLNGRCGLANDKGEVILPVKYSEIKASKHGGYLVKANDKYGLVSTEGKEILPVSYDEIIALKGDKFMLKSNGNYTLTDAMGRRYSAKIHKVADNLCAFCIDEWVFVDDAGNPVDVSDRALFYTTNDGNKLDVSLGSAKHLFSRGYGVVLFDTPPTAIERFAFARCKNLESITIPNSVTSIGYSAFFGCYNLVDVKLSKNLVSIEREAFLWCKNLESITIPDSVTKIGEGAFSWCNKMLGFYGKLATRDNRCLIVDGVLVAATLNGLTQFTVPDGVTSIGNIAFCNCENLTSVTIPAAVVKFEENAFVSCDNVKEVHISDLSAWCKNDFVDYDANPCAYGAKLYLNGKELTTLVIPSDVKVLGNAFCGCSSITSVTIPDNVVEFREEVFRNCSNLRAFYGKFASSDNRCLVVNGSLCFFAKGCGLTSYTIPSGVKVIAYRAFYACNSLTSVTLPSYVTDIVDEAFAECNSLTNVTIQNKNLEVDVYTFAGCGGSYTPLVVTQCGVTLEVNTEYYGK